MHLNNQLWFTRDMLILSLSVLVGFEFIRSVLADAWIHMENIQQNPRTVLQFQEQMMERIGQYQQGVAKRHEEKTRWDLCPCHEQRGTSSFSNTSPVYPSILYFMLGVHRPDRRLAFHAPIFKLPHERYI